MAPARAGQPGRPLIFDTLIIDPDRREVTLNDEVFHLKPKEYELLVFFAQNRRIVLGRYLIYNVFGDGITVAAAAPLFRPRHARWLHEGLGFPRQPSARGPGAMPIRQCLVIPVTPATG